MLTTEPSLADLAAASGLEPRTIRPWVAQGLLPPSLTRGPAACYPADTLSRLLAIRTMRDALGMSLSDIRKELLVASPEQIAAYPARAKTLATPSPPAGNPASSALKYIANLRAGMPKPPPPLRQKRPRRGRAPQQGSRRWNIVLGRDARSRPARPARRNGSASPSPPTLS